MTSTSRRDPILDDVVPDRTISRAVHADPAAGERRAWRQVVDAYHLGACVRRPSELRKAMGERGYHKGWEIRFYADTEHDAQLIARLLADAGLKAGRPYRKHRYTWIVPLYGRRAVDQVLAWVDEAARTD